MKADELTLARCIEDDPTHIPWDRQDVIRAGAISELRELFEDYCGRDSCWLEPGHDGECKPGGCA